MTWLLAPGLSSVARAQNAESMDESSAVIFVYHRFGESDFPTTNITVDQFTQHLAAIERGGHTVLPLPDLLDMYTNTTAVPSRAIVLTVDDAYRSVFEVAWPLLKQRGHTFTLFVATDSVDRGSDKYMTWDMIRELQAAGVTIASQTASHLRMATATLERNRADLEKSQVRFQEELGFKPDLIAYPYGEYSLEVQNLVRDMGFRAGLAQHSGVSHAAGDLFAIPRFPLNENYGDLDAFKLRANAQALPITDLIPLDPLIANINPPAIGFTLDDQIENPQRLSCYLGNLLDIEWLGERRAEIRLTEPLRVGRSRLNCTIMSPQGRWRWFGAILLVPRS